MDVVSKITFSDQTQPQSAAVVVTLVLAVYPVVTTAAHTWQEFPCRC